MARRGITMWAVLLALGTVVAPAAIAAGADVPRVAVTLPDLQVLVPVGAISIGTNPSTGHRQLQFTHVTWDAGAGPFAIQPSYDPASGLSRFSQVLYESPAPGRWTAVSQLPLALDGVFEPPSDYRYPLTRFTLNALGKGGAIGAIARVSPKVDYCITGDTYVGGVPNTPDTTSPPQSDCADPTRLLGFSVGWGDQYDQTDNGQPIDLTGVPDGTYILRAVADPQHLFAESNRSNDVVDTKLRITGTTVTVLSQTRPRIDPPLVAVTSPPQGATVTGSATLQAVASASPPATVAFVQYLVDGVRVGPHITRAPYRYTWATGPLPGTHTISAQVQDTSGMVGTSPVRVVHVARGHAQGLGIDAVASADVHGVARTSPLSTTARGDVLVAFAGLDGPSSGGQSATVSGLGLAWHLVRRANVQAGDAEVWTARAAGLVRAGVVTSTPRDLGYAQQLFVLAMSGASGIGASASASGPHGAQSATVRTLGARSEVFAVGTDWDQAIARAPAAGEVLLRQWVDAADGDTFWVQGTSGAVRSAGTRVNLADVAPTADRWDVAAVEVRAAPLPAASVIVANPEPGEVVSGVSPVAVEVHDAAGVRSVQVLVDGVVVPTRRHGALLSIARWDTRAVANGPHRIEAVVRDASGRRSRARAEVLVSNPRPAMTCFVLQANVTVSGDARATTRTIHVASAGERLLALVRLTTPAEHGAVTSTPVLPWRLEAVEHAHGTTVAVWTVRSTSWLRSLRVRSTAAGPQVMTVLALEGTDGLGATVASSGAGRPALSLTTTRPTSLVIAVGFGTLDQRSRPGWATLSDAGLGRVVTWVTYTNQPAAAARSRVVLPSPRGDWSIVALELPGDD